jgi:hypothetical protein
MDSVQKHNICFVRDSFELQMSEPIYKRTHSNTVDIAKQKYKNNILLFDYIRLIRQLFDKAFV